MALDVASLLAPVAGDATCGPDLSYDPARLEIEKAFDQPFSIDTAGGPAQSAETDWDALIERIGEQFARTKDIWLAVYLCRAGARARRLEIVEIGAEALSGLLSQYWDGVHPQIEQDADLEMRKTPCDSLGSPATLILPLGRIPIVSHARLGKFSVADLERLRRGGVKEADYAALLATLAELGEDALVEADARFGRIATAFRSIEAAFLAKSGGKIAPRLGPAYEFLADASKTIRSFVKKPAGEPEKESGAAEGAASPAALIAGEPRTREDVIRALEAICEYYRKNEPASPVPLLMQRAKAWVPLAFLEVLSDIAPEGMAEARRILALREKKG
jgi:type VI secretion system protein ImpA